MINLSNLGDSLNYLVNNDASYQQMKNDFPEVLADWISMKNNPNCSCKERVNKYFHGRIVKEPNLLDKYVKNTEEFKSFLDNIIKQRIESNYSGRIFLIPKNEESWKEFANKCSTKSFRSFSIVERENEVAIYFI